MPARHLWQPQNICPSEAEPLDVRNRVYIVWKVPGQDWAGIHYGAGHLPWSQLRSWACAADNMLYPAAASKQLRWCRASNCTHEQLATAFQREAGGQELRYMSMAHMNGHTIPMKTADMAFSTWTIQTPGGEDFAGPGPRFVMKNP